ncbi:MAG: NAD(P)H-dependent glycerol-3-phosphate dehydrogenase [Thiomonas sp.]
MQNSASLISAGTASRPAVATPVVAVLGAGAWGTALASALRRGGLDVTLWARRPDLTHAIATTGRNPRHLPELELPAGLKASSQMAQVLEGADVVIMAVPSTALRGVARVAAPLVQHGAVVLAACKGIERDSGALMTQVLQDELRRDALIGAIGGPSFAHEIVCGQHAALTVGLPALRLRTEAAAQARAQRIVAGLHSAFTTGRVQLDATDDAIGVQIGGALKNMIAIACGMAMSCGQGENARAAILTRGLQDMRQLTLALGGRPETLLSSAGAGDLFLTASSAQSRNTRLGMRLGRGEYPSGDGELAEGAVSCLSVQTLERRLGFTLQVAAAVRDVLQRRQTAEDALHRLLTQPMQHDDALSIPRVHGGHLLKPVREPAPVRLGAPRPLARHPQ